MLMIIMVIDAGMPTFRMFLSTPHEGLQNLGEKDTYDAFQKFPEVDEACREIVEST